MVGFLWGPPRGCHHLFSGVRSSQIILGLIQTEACVIPNYHGMLIQGLGAKYEKILHPLVDFAILSTTKSPEFCDLRERVGL